MKRKILMSALALTIALSLTKAPVIKANDRVKDMISSMTLDQKIGQMLMPDFRKWKQNGETGAKNLTVLNNEVKEIIDTYDFGGVILFAENVAETKQTFDLTNDLQAAAVQNDAGNGNIPLFITIDQEGGIVYRLGSGTALPGNMAIGATRSKDYSKKAGQIIGRELSALGINVNFSPVLDVNNNPNNPVIGLRSFSSKPQLVADLGLEMIKGLQEYNISTSAKHFPGHGDTDTDSHTGLPKVDKSYEQLKEVELLPFQVAMDNGVDMVMTAHIQYPQLEEEQVVSKLDGQNIYVPATLSDDIITGIVREKMKYDGVVITDAMNMDAISKHFGESEATIKAIQADVDIVLMPTILRSRDDLAKLDTIIADIKEAINTNKISMETIDKSVERILRLKEKRGILDYSKNLKSYEERLAIANKEVGSQLNRDTEREIAEAAVTVVKSENGILPLMPQANEKVLLLAPYNNELPGLELGMRRLQAEGYVSNEVQYETFKYGSTTTEEELKAKIDDANYVVVISEISSSSRLAQSNWLTKVPTTVVRESNKQDKPAVILSISRPYDLANYPEAKAVVAAFGSKGMDPTESLRPDKAFGPNIPAGIQVIFGGAEAKGILPIDIPVIKEEKIVAEEILYTFGHGITYPKVTSEVKQEVSENLPKVLYPFNAFDNGTTFKANLKSENENEVLYDIFFEKEGQKVQPRKEVKVFVPYDTTKEVVALYHDGQSVLFTKEGEYLVTNVSHFSEFKVVYKSVVQNIDTPKDTVDNKVIETPELAKNKKDVDTSDYTFIYGLFALGSLFGLKKLKK